MSKSDPQKLLPESNDWEMYTRTHEDPTADKSDLLFALVLDTIDRLKHRATEDAAFYAQAKEFLIMSGALTLQASKKNQLVAAMKRQVRKSKN
jgi:hypothetical protein